jgi:hypothetical protein
MDSQQLDATFLKNEHYDNIPNWTQKRCLIFLSLSEFTQRDLRGAKPTASRMAVAKRLREFNAASYPETRTHPDDYNIVVNSFINMKSIVESDLTWKVLPVIYHGNRHILQNGLDTRFECLSKMQPGIQEHHIEMVCQRQVANEKELPSE